MHRKNVFSLSVVLVAALLSACTSTPPAPAVVSAPDPAAVELDQKLRVANAPVNVSSNSPRPAQVGADVKSASPTMRACPKAPDTNCVSISYYGDASVLLKNLTNLMGSGWTFEVTGPEPRLPIYVQASAVEMPTQEFLGGIAQQLAQRADIVVRGQKIELRYRAPR